jgi:tRNA(Ile)-lysidine synthase
VTAGELRAALAPWLPRLRALPGRDRPVVVACSGGADSLALLALACASGHDVVAVHVDHGLRPAGAHEAAVVERAARRVGARAVAVRTAVAHGPNLEARARAARYAALEHASRDAGASTVLVGHTADDQAETVLLNLLRGSATAGLAGAVVEREGLARPLLSLRRSDTVEICARLGLDPVDDPMNGDLRHRRVWLRREVIPVLERGAARDLRAVLARQADVLRDEHALLSALGDRALASLGDPPDADALARLEPALARLAVRRWLGDPPPSLAHVDAVLSVARGERRAVEVGGGRRVARYAGRLHAVGGHGNDQDMPRSATIGLPGRAGVDGLVVDAWVERAAPVAWPDGRSVCVLDADLVGPRATLRAPMPGDRLQPLGLQGTKAVGTALAEAGVGGDARRGARVLVASEGAPVGAGSVLWVVGYRIDHRVRVTSRTRSFLWISVDRSPIVSDAR